MLRREPPCTTHAPLLMPLTVTPLTQKIKLFADLIDGILASEGDFSKLPVSIGYGESLAECRRRLLKMVHPDKLEWLRDTELKKKAETATKMVNSW